MVRAEESEVENIERGYWKRKFAEILTDWRLYIMLIPMLFFLVCWKYLPIASLVMSFKYYDASLGVYNSPYVGIYWFTKLFTGDQAAAFWKAFRNTFVLSFYGLCFGFPVPIIMALLFSEIKAVYYRAAVQILSYLPHFVSVVVITSIVTMMCRHSTTSATTGVTSGAGPIAAIFEALGHNENLIYNPSCFRAVFQVSGIWSDAGYGSIVYFAAILSISPTNYEAARIDGASKMQQVRYVTIPGMLSTLVIMLILRIGSLFNIGYEKVILLNPSSGDPGTGLYETAEIISTWVYHNSMSGSGGIPESEGAAADMFNSLLSMLLVIGSNKIAKKVSKTSLY